MSPIDFNPNNKPLDLQDKNQQAISKPDTGVSANSGDAPAADKFLKSEVLEAIQNLATNINTNETQERADKISSIKQQVEQRSYPIISDDSAARSKASATVADKLIKIDALFSQ